MSKFKLTLEYDGSRYAGWQLQKNERTVQGELLQAAAKIFENQPVEIYSAGRTDAGVHARGQVAHLELTDTRLSPEQIMVRLNDELGHAINILHVEKVHPKFHARHDARSRSYTYQISKRRDAFGKKYVWWVRETLDLGTMRNAASLLEGFHDFRSFGVNEKDGKSTLVDLDRVEIREDGDRIYIHITGSHFLWKMVRRIVGVLVEVGRGKMTGQDVETFLKTNSNEPARYTAPPSGLFLERVDY
ncbi:MAG: tRNA pseudouridine(38-40) synthase TruA [Saprospiraceae bacterium]